MDVQIIFLLSVTVLFFGPFIADSTEFVPVGCYRDLQIAPRPLPNLIHNYRVNNEIDWLDLNNSVIKPCAERVRKTGYLYFGLQFYGECWSGALAHLSFMKDGSSNSCVNGVGRGFANMVYRLVGQERECKDYKLLSSQNRSALRTNDPSKLLLCDGPFQLEGSEAALWYRFGGKAGNQMADLPIPSGRCQTRLGGWFRGPYPNVTEGIVNRDVCFGSDLDCKELQPEKIRIRNCGSFYVYKLGPVSSCQTRFCGNGLPTKPLTVEI